MSSVDYFSLDRMADEASRQAQEYLGHADYCEKRSRDLVQQAEQYRKYASNRDNDAKRYRSMADADYCRKHGEPYTLKTAS